MKRINRIKDKFVQYCQEEDAIKNEDEEKEKVSIQ